MADVALVTGGTRGIGEAISLALKAAGCKVAANYAHNDEAAKEFSQRNGIPVFKWDVSNFDECKKGAEAVTKEVGAIDVLVNNAGITRDATLHKMKPENWEEVIKTNLTSCFNMCHAVIDSMRERNYGRIINISSVNAQMGQFGQTNYSAAKAGILGFSKALARESANKGITVNSIAPGYIDTDMVRHVKEDILQKIIAQIPVGRLGKPEEIGRAVVFLADRSAGFITGETISINGGYEME